MSYDLFLVVFAGAGALLLGGLTMADAIDGFLSSLRLRRVQAAGEFGDRSPSPRRIAERLRRRLRFVAETKSGEGVGVKASSQGEAEGLSSDLRAQIEELRAQAEKIIREITGDEVVSTYYRLLKLLRDTFVPKKVEFGRFPLRAYARADARTRDTVLQLMIVLRALREAEMSGLIVEQASESTSGESRA
jgi:hypothetical protein